MRAASPMAKARDRTRRQGSARARRNVYLLGININRAARCSVRASSNLPQYQEKLFVRRGRFAQQLHAHNLPRADSTPELSH